MSTSSEYSGFSGHFPPPEKSTFSQTCTLLSQYLKEKGSFGDLTLGITCSLETNENIYPKTVMDFPVFHMGFPQPFPVFYMRFPHPSRVTGSPETSCHSATTMELFPGIMTQRNPTAMDFLSPQTAVPLRSEVPTIVKPSSFKSMEKEPKASQLTIFYAGQVVVFDDFPADKAEEIISLVSKKTPQQSRNSSAYAHTHNQNHPSFVPNITPQTPSRPIACDLPIARKISLHRFLEKRKDRIAAKAPYQTHTPKFVSDKPAESMAWLGLSAKSTQI